MPGAAIHPTAIIEIFEEFGVCGALDLSPGKADI
jgi:hypothetical protein